MKKLLVTVCVICILLPMVSISAFAANLETNEFQERPISMQPARLFWIL